MCGSATHPGGGIMGAPGRNAALRILADTRRECRHHRRPGTMAWPPRSTSLKPDSNRLCSRRAMPAVGGAVTSELHPGFRCPTLTHNTPLSVSRRTRHGARRSWPRCASRSGRYVRTRSEWTSARRASRFRQASEAIADKATRLTPMRMRHIEWPWRRSPAWWRRCSSHRRPTSIIRRPMISGIC